MTWCEMIGTMVAHDVFMSTGDTAAATRAGRAAQISCMLGL
ncbi:hypothetical protein [Flavobacterium sp.]